MLELLTIKKPGGFVFKTGITGSVVPMVGRSNFFSALNGDNLTIVGGVSYSGSGIGNYPTRADRINIKTGFTGTFTAPQYYTWGGGGASAVNGNLMYLADFYDSGFRSVLTTLNTSTNIFSNIGSVTTPLRHSSLMIYFDNKIYRFGGYTGQSTDGGVTDDAQVYSLVNQNWTKLAKMPIPCNGITGCLKNNKIYIFHGYDGRNKKNIGGVQIYDILTNTWTFKELPDYRELSWGAGCLVGDYFYYTTWLNGYLNIRRYYLKNLDKNYGSFSTTHSNRFACNIHYHPGENCLIIAGGCVQGPGSANYDSLTKISEILKIPLVNLR